MVENKTISDTDDAGAGGGGATSSREQEQEEERERRRRRSVYLLKGGELVLQTDGVREYEKSLEKRIAKLGSSSLVV